MSDQPFRVILRCPTCRAVLVVDRGHYVSATLGDLRIYKDTGKVVAWCRRCPQQVVLEEPKTAFEQPTEITSLRVVLTGS